MRSRPLDGREKAQTAQKGVVEVDLHDGKLAELIDRHRLDAFVLENVR
ncbi:MAG: hypothetical protein ABSG04_05965 [Verrucomicrobiota bacterium]